MPLTEEKLVLLDLQAEDGDAVIRALGERLTDLGYVKDSFTEAVLAREKAYPTGLPTQGPKVAIPHADVEHVLRPAIAIAVLRNPVAFGEMGNPDQVVMVKIVCMLAIKESETLGSLLKNLVEMFRDPKTLEQITEASKPSDIVDLFNKRLPIPQEA
jgi:PTS system galactitol-specific IIA component